MLKHLTVKQHLEMAEKQWLLVATEGVSKQEALSKLLGFDVETFITRRELREQVPIENCFLCEVFHELFQETSCWLCPLQKGTDKEDYITCGDIGEPYAEYADAWYGAGKINTKAAMKIVELIRAGKKRFNY